SIGGPPPSSRRNCDRYYHASFERNRCRSSTAGVRFLSQNSIPDGPFGSTVHQGMRCRRCIGICPQVPHEGPFDSGNTSGPCRTNLHLSICSPVMFATVALLDP